MNSSLAWRNALPFLPGKSALIERVAQRHHASADSDPSIGLLRQDHGWPSWKEILEAGFVGLERTGVEIAGATTEAEAVSARLRKETILDALREAEISLLDQAARRLADGLANGFFSYGRRGLTGKFEPIPPQHWLAGDIDWEKWRLSVAGQPAWNGIRVLDLWDLDADQIQCVENDFKPTKQQGVGGRPTEHDWDGARQFADKYVAENGLPATRKRLIEAVADWFVKNDGAVAPSDRQIRENVTAELYSSA